MENEFNIFSGTSEFTLTSNSFPQYKINVDKIKTIRDVRLILKHLQLHFAPATKEEYEEMKHLLIIN
jgi:hypothetical protein